MEKQHSLNAAMNRPLNDGSKVLQWQPNLWSIDGQGFEFEHMQRDPKGGDLCPITVKPWETAVEAGRCTDVQIVCRNLA